MTDLRLEILVQILPGPASTAGPLARRNPRASRISNSQPFDPLVVHSPRTFSTSVRNPLLGVVQASPETSRKRAGRPSIACFPWAGCWICGSAQFWQTWSPDGSTRIEPASACESRKHEQRATCLFYWLHHHRRPIRQHFGDALHDFGGIVASAYDCVSAQFGGVLQHQVKGFSASLFAQVGQQCDVAAQDGLQSCSNRAED